MIPTSKVALTLSRHVACSLLLLAFSRSFAAAQRPSSDPQSRGKSKYTYGSVDHSGKPETASVHAQSPIQQADHVLTIKKWLTKEAASNVRVACATGGAPAMARDLNSVDNSSDTAGQLCLAALQHAADDGALLDLFEKNDNVPADRHMRNLIYGVFLDGHDKNELRGMGIKPSLLFDAGFTQAFVHQRTPGTLTPDVISHDMQPDTDASRAAMQNASPNPIGHAVMLDSQQMGSFLEDAENNNGTLIEAALAGMAYGAQYYQETHQGKSTGSHYVYNAAPSGQKQYTYASTDRGNNKTPETPLAAPIPSVIHFCGQHCLTFTLERDGKLHNYTNLAGQYNEHRILAIEKFTPGSPPQRYRQQPLDLSLLRPDGLRQ